MTNLELGSRLSKKRREAGLSLEELAKKSGVGKGTITKIVSGDTKSPAIGTMIALAKALEVPLEYFTGSTPERSPIETVWEGRTAQEQRIILSFLRELGEGLHIRAK